MKERYLTSISGPHSTTNINHRRDPNTCRPRRRTNIPSQRSRAIFINTTLPCPSIPPPHITSIHRLGVSHHNRSPTLTPRPSADAANRPVISPRPQILHWSNRRPAVHNQDRRRVQNDVHTSFVAHPNAAGQHNPAIHHAIHSHLPAGVHGN